MSAWVGSGVTFNDSSKPRPQQSKDCSAWILMPSGDPVHACNLLAVKLKYFYESWYYLVNDALLIIFVNGQSSAWDGELKKNITLPDKNLSPEWGRWGRAPPCRRTRGPARWLKELNWEHFRQNPFHLMMPDSSNESNDRDHKQKDATGSDASNNGQGSHYARYFSCKFWFIFIQTQPSFSISTMNSHSYHEEGDKDVDDIQPHQCVLGARKAPAHFVWKEMRFE